LRDYDKVALDELLMKAPWELEGVWRRWESDSHINRQGGRTVTHWLRDLCHSSQGCRAFGVVDARVTLGSVAKGRSPSSAVTRVLQMDMPLQIAGGLHPGLGFGPTRLNVADDPTRGRPIRSPAGPPGAWLSKPRWLEKALQTAPGTGAMVAWTRFALALLSRDAEESCPLGPSARPWKRALPAPLAARLRQPTPAQSGEAPEPPVSEALLAPGLPVAQPPRGPRRNGGRQS